jgi:hypothetical protein
VNLPYRWTGSQRGQTPAPTTPWARGRRPRSSAAPSSLFVVRERPRVVSAGGERRLDPRGAYAEIFGSLSHADRTFWLVTAAFFPLVRESIFRMLPDDRFGEAQYVGGYWTRKGDVEVDLIGAEEKVRPRRVAFVGSIKWRERVPFGGRDLGRIAAQREEVPGTDEDTVLVGLSRGGFDKQGSGLDAALVPEDLLEAWKR